MSDTKPAAGAATHDVVIIGAGISGLSAATQAARLGLTTALYDDGLLGGLITNIGAVQGSEHQGEAGADLVTTLLGDALEAGVDYQMGEITKIAETGGLWRLSDDAVIAPRVILATGAGFRSLGVPGEERLMGRGVSQCAFCDGGLYRDKDVAVIGGGDSAFQEAQHLAGICANVTILIRGEGPRARSAFVSELAPHKNVHIRLHASVQEILGDGGVEGLRYAAQGCDKVEVLSVEAVFPFVGLAPKTSMAPASAKRDDDGALVVGADMQTDQSGLYAIGAARSGYGGAISDALADAKAAVQAVRSATS